MLTSENSLIKMAGKAKEETEKSEELEKVQLAIISATMNENHALTKEALDNSLSSEFENDICTIGKKEGPWIYKSNSNINYIIDSKGKIILKMKIEILGTSNTKSQAEIENYSQGEKKLTWNQLYCIANEIVYDTKNNITSNTSTIDMKIDEVLYKIGVGDIIDVKIGDTSYETVIIGFKHDTIAEIDSYGNLIENNLKKAGISFQFKNSICNYKMNSQLTNEGGWNESEIKNYINSEEFFGDFETDLKSIIKNVVKKGQNQIHKTNNDGQVIVENTLEENTYSNLWLLSLKEVLNYNVEQCGEQYQYYKLGNSALKYSDDKEQVATRWWLRSVVKSTTTSFWFVTNYAPAVGDYGYATHSFGIIPGFAI